MGMARHLTSIAKKLSVKFKVPTIYIFVRLNLLLNPPISTGYDWRLSQCRTRVSFNNLLRTLLFVISLVATHISHTKCTIVKSVMFINHCRRYCYLYFACHSILFDEIV